MKEIEIYVHIPFCERKCEYCNFTSYCVGTKLFTQYIDKLKEEIKEKLIRDYIITSIFFGGGTPSFLPSNLIREVLNLIKSISKLTKDCEISIECNPNSTTKEKLLDYLDSGFNRISFGVQSFNDVILKNLGRLHNEEKAVNAVNLANLVGFKNINLDLMIGVEGQTLSILEHDLLTACNLPVKHISCYSLILEEGTTTYKKVNNGFITLPSEDEVISMYDYVKTYLEKYGYYRYEVSNFAKLSYECRHNLGYWNMSNYLGFGVAAHSFVNNVRSYNTDNLNDYISCNNFDEVSSSEIIDKKEAFEEYIMLSLRTNKGVNLEKCKEEYGVDLLENKDTIDFLKNNGLIKIDKSNLLATDKGFHVLNQIIIKLI